jgi:hypothetical protein
VWCIRTSKHTPDKKYKKNNLKRVETEEAPSAMTGLFCWLSLAVVYALKRRRTIETLDIYDEDDGVSLTMRTGL